MTTYSAGTYRLDGPVISFGDERTPHYKHGDRVEIRTSQRPDGQGDVYAYNTRTGRGAFIRAASLTKIPGASDFKEGDRVVVARDAKTTDGGGVYFGKETEGTVERASDFARDEGNISVKAPDVGGTEISQHVAPEYLTKVTPPRPKPTGASFGRLRGYAERDAMLSAALFRQTSGLGFTPPAPPVEKVTVEAVRKALDLADTPKEDAEKMLRVIKAIDEGVRK